MMVMMVDNDGGKRRRNGWAWETKGPCSAPLFSVRWARKRGKEWVMAGLNMDVIMEHEGGGERGRVTDGIWKRERRHALFSQTLVFGSARQGKRRGRRKEKSWG